MARSSSKPVGRLPQAALFAALGDETRLALVLKLSAGESYSIAQLTTGSRLTRQAVSKHLRVLQQVGLVHNVRHGRESLFALDPKPIAEMHEVLETVSRQRDQALLRLPSFVAE